MVLTGMINTGEASDLRKVVMGYKCSVVDVFYDIMQKTDDELLAELHQFSDGIKKYDV
uniref:Uncharacterized protein n=1 Tax=Rhizophora mucronata TaxID=61149 RepID=A0A2P2L1F1_RHIMU